MCSTYVFGLDEDGRKIEENMIGVVGGGEYMIFLLLYSNC